MDILEQRARKVIPKSFLNGKIYKIYNDVNDMIYIGSTTQSLPKRYYNHRSEAMCLYDTSPLHVAMKLIGKEHFNILLVELFPCTCKAELEAKEYAVMDTYSKDKLYNSIQNGRFSEEAKQKMSISNPRSLLGKVQAGSHNFRRGCIQDMAAGKYFRFVWGLVGARKSKSFGYSKIRTRQAAYMMCVDLRNEIYPMTYDDYSKELPFYEE